MAQPSEVITGIVAAANETGLRLEGEQKWRNYGRQRDLPIPDRGDHVSLRAAGPWIDELVIGGELPAAPAASNGNGHITEKDQLHARMSALKAAVRLAGARIDRGDQVSSSDVLPVADRYLSWLVGESR